MICPTCKNIMIVVEHERVELDYCTSCQGVWFDSGELALLLETMGLEEAGLSLSNILTSPEAKTAEKKRNCPICGQKMGKATIGQKPEVLIDVCRHGDGLWFDGDEVGQLLTQLAGKPARQALAGGPSQRADSQGGVITFIREVFRARE